MTSRPQQGGRWIRDPVTGALVRAETQPSALPAPQTVIAEEAPKPAPQTASDHTDPIPSDAAPSRASRKRN